MNRFQLFCLLRRNNNLSYRRNPAFEQGMVAKVLMWIGGGIFVIYMLAGGIGLGAAAAKEGDVAFIAGMMPFILLIDFGLRFMVQQTPDMLVKPYLLQPLPRNSVIETFLVTSLLSTYNWLWLFLFVPYAIITTAGGLGFLASLGVLLCSQLMMLVNSQFYLMVRTLVGRNLLWWFIPILVYGSYFLLLFVDGDLFEKTIENVISLMSDAWWMIPVILAVLVGIFFLNRRMQFAFVYEEVAAQEKKSAALKHVSQFSFLERFGQTGEYMKLEIKSVMRNKAMRSRFIASLSLIIVFTLLIAYTPIYDGKMMSNFWCLYCFALYGVTSLVKIMAPEGNYIDLLMTNRENILTLLKAKYYFHCAILLVPFFVMIPAVVEGKFSVLMLFAYMFISSGLIYFIMFQLAVTNKQTMPLNEKISGKGNIENGSQLILELIAMFAPFILVFVLMFFFSERVCYLILLVTGLVFTLTHPLWLRHVYQRMMKNRYENLEGFRATR